MKKILNIIALSTIVLMASCDMDRMPHGFVDPKEAFKDVQTIKALENGAYARLRDNYITSSMLTADIQADYVNAAKAYSNTYGDMYKWTIIQEDRDIASAWNQCYMTIGQCNFILNNTEEDQHEFESDDLVALELIRGRVFLMRAMSYSLLAERFCADYDVATAKNEYTGVPLLTTLDPESKPGRATLYDVYDRILKDIEAAKSRLARQAGAANSVYLNIDCVTALEAHVYLQMDLYPEALKAAQSLIENPNYTLAANIDEFKDIWTYDRGNEVIFKFAASKTELPDPYGAFFCSDQFSGTGKIPDTVRPLYYWTADYIPTQDFIDLYAAEDYRQAWFFTGLDQSIEQRFWTGRYLIMPSFTMLYKFPGNPDLRTDNSWNTVNAWKLFRIAEMYLIAAEAATQIPGGDAKTPINTLRAHRGLTTPLDNVVLDDVKLERYKEMVLEGTRLTDLKRWGDGMKRGKAQKGDIYSFGPMNSSGNQSLVLEQQDGDLSNELGRELDIKAGDYRFIWPIPFSEIFANQNLSGQQNPGWVK